jgi:hypothetical protein
VSHSRQVCVTSSLLTQGKAYCYISERLRLTSQADAAGMHHGSHFAITSDSQSSKVRVLLLCLLFILRWKSTVLRQIHTPSSGPGSSLMSESPLREYQCNNCNRAVPLQVCQSNKKGNAGRLYAICNLQHADRPPCNFFRWASPRSSPSASQTQSPSLSSHPPPASIPTEHLLAATSQALAAGATVSGEPQLIPFPVPVNPTKCVTRGCSSTRVHPTCRRQECRKHCVAHGGCPTKGHVAKTAPSVATDGAQPGIAPLWILDPPSIAQSADELPVQNQPPTHHSSVTPSISTAAVASISSPSSLPRIEPRFASQMPSIFTEQIAKEEKLREKRRLADAERIARTVDVKNGVIVYGWHKVRFP